MNCPHCGGLTYLDEDHDRACLICGRVIVAPRRDTLIPPEWRKREGTFVRARRT